MRVMSFNILYGGQDRFEQILEVIRELSPDVLALQECNGWEDGTRLGETAGCMGAEHTYLGLSSPRGSGKRFHVALLSRLPFQRIQTHADPRYQAHCLIEAVIEDVTVFAAHFVSANENMRFVEARSLIGCLPPSGEFQRGRYLLLGDLNAISRKDPYPADLAERLQAAGIDKYHHPPRFDVIDELENYGWVDTLYKQATPPQHWVTAPRALDFRTDYVFATPPMIERLKRAWVHALSAGESDHFPVLAEFLPA